MSLKGCWIQKHNHWFMRHRHSDVEQQQNMAKGFPDMDEVDTVGVEDKCVEIGVWCIAREQKWRDVEFVTQVLYRVRSVIHCLKER